MWPWKTMVMSPGAGAMRGERRRSTANFHGGLATNSPLWTELVHTGSRWPWLHGKSTKAMLTWYQGKVNHLVKLLLKYQGKVNHQYEIPISKSLHRCVLHIISSLLLPWNIGFHRFFACICCILLCIKVCVCVFIYAAHDIAHLQASKAVSLHQRVVTVPYRYIEKGDCASSYLYMSPDTCIYVSGAAHGDAPFPSHRQWSILYVWCQYVYNFTYSSMWTQ